MLRLQSLRRQRRGRGWGVSLSLPTAEDIAAIVRREVREAVDELRASLNPAPLVTVEEAARLTGISVATMRRRIKDGAVPVVRRGRTVRIDPALLRPPTEGQLLEFSHRARHP
jgi:excisionase family DNA binding protein